LDLIEKRNKKIGFVLFDAVIIFVLIGVGFRYFCNMSQYNENILDERIFTTIHRADGRIESYTSNLIPEATGEDVVDFNIRLPDKNPFKETTLCAVVYNCKIEVFHDEDVLFEYASGSSRNSGRLGNTLITVPVSDDLFGKEIIVRCTVPLGGTITKLENVRLMPSDYSLRYVLINHEIDFVFCISLVAVSVVAMMLMLNFGGFNDLVREGMYLFCFFITIGLWVLGSNNMLYLFINNPIICSTLEYIAMFMMPMWFCAFLSLELSEKFKNLYIFLSIFYGLIFLEVVSLNYTTPMKYYHFTHMERILIFFGLIVTVLILIINKNKQTKSEKIIKIGTVCSIIVMTAEVVRYELKDTSYLFRQLFSTSLSVFGIIIFVFSLFYGYYIKIYSELTKQKALERVAYTDGMTGIANRTAVNEYLNNLQTTDSYGIVFFDVNDLKKANDVYSHEVGDKLITVVANALRNSFDDDRGFYGRYGGDEFVAGYINEAEDLIKSSLERFDDEIKKINAEKQLPFDVRVAYGFYLNDPSDPLSADKGVKVADDRMYENKKAMKAKYK